MPAILSLLARHGVHPSSCPGRKRWQQQLRAPPLRGGADGNRAALRRWWRRRQSAGRRLRLRGEGRGVGGGLGRLRHGFVHDAGGRADRGCSLGLHVLGRNRRFAGHLVVGRVGLRGGHTALVVAGLDDGRRRLVRRRRGADPDGALGCHLLGRHRRVAKHVVVGGVGRGRSTGWTRRPCHCRPRRRAQAPCSPPAWR